MDTPVAPTRLVVGLGNPGRRYDGTRHNLGFEVVAELAKRRGVTVVREECGALVGEAGELLLVLPQTYMNRSGHALRCLLERRGFAPDAALVVYDDVNLPLGRLRLRPSGSPGGHRGMESVIESLRSDAVPRLRLGIAPVEPVTGEALADFVLAPFAAVEQEAVATMVQRAADACALWAEGESLERVMSRANA